MERAGVKVWDPFVRLFHWSLVAGFALAWLSAEESRSLHEYLGYAVAGLVLARVLWGFVGSRHARFSDFLRPPRAVLAYLGDIARRREARYLGHNPAGAAMIVALLVAIGGTALSGWLYTTDRFWGVEWVEEAHELLAHLTLALVALHVAGVALASRRHAENLVRAMIDGRKRAAAGDDVG